MPSAAMTVTLYGPLPAAPAPTLPLIAPVAGLMDKPEGSPKAAYFKVEPLTESEAVIESATESLSVLVWSLGWVMLMGLFTFHAKLWAAEWVPSPATIVTVYGPLAAAPSPTVPVMAPLVVLILRPAGKPRA